MQRFVFAIILTALASITLEAKVYNLLSPDGKISMEISVNPSDLSFMVDVDGSETFALRDIKVIKDGTDAPYKVRRVMRASIKNVLHPVVAQKSESLIEEYNSLIIKLSRRRTVEFRAYDNGIAYRWVLKGKKSSVITDETAVFDLGEDTGIWYPHEESFYSANEQKFNKTTLNELGAGRLASLPTLFYKEHVKLLVEESDLLDYAGLWLDAMGDGTLKAVFPYYPRTLEKSGDRDEFVTDREDYIAKFSRKAKLPWRIVAISREDKDLLVNTLVYQMASPSDGDYSWVKPGKAQWDWWNDMNISGVDFNVGINTETYKYYIDFAAANGFEYVVLDEGWSSRESLLEVNPEVDVPGIIEYAKSKNVGVILWCTWLRLDECLEEALTQFEKWGVSAIKVDFMSRDDQPMVNYYVRVAQAAARHRLLVDFHGCHKPAGLYRTYPNVLTFEGVYGLEQSKADQTGTIGPDHNLILPFTRMVCGPMDYTPGAVRNAHKGKWQASYHAPVGMGTRAHHMAMYVVYESPLQMVCDSPTHYMAEEESLEIIKAMPTVWKRTIPLAAEVGGYVVLARETFDGRWMIGAMTNSKGRQLSVKLDFLGEGKYEAVLFKDGPNAVEDANNYRIENVTVNKDTTLSIDMVDEGGYVAIIRKQ